jgi:hypothetical protein
MGSEQSDARNESVSISKRCRKNRKAYGAYVRNRNSEYRCAGVFCSRPSRVKETVSLKRKS